MIISCNELSPNITLYEKTRPTKKHSWRFFPHLSIEEVWQILRIRFDASGVGSWPRSPTQHSRNKDSMEGNFTTWLPLYVCILKYIYIYIIIIYIYLFIIYIYIYLFIYLYKYKGARPKTFS